MMGKSGVLQSMGSQRVRFHLVTEQEEQSCIECLLNASTGAALSSLGRFTL